MQKKRMLQLAGVAAAIAIVGSWIGVMVQERTARTMQAQAASSGGGLPPAGGRPYQRTDGLDVPYVPTPERVVEEMLKLAAVKKDDVVYDLGCGDGRIVITAAK